MTTTTTPKVCITGSRDEDGEKVEGESIVYLGDVRIGKVIINDSVSKGYHGRYTAYSSHHDPATEVTGYERAYGRIKTNKHVTDTRADAVAFLIARHGQFTGMSATSMSATGTKMGDLMANNDEQYPNYYAFEREAARVRILSTMAYFAKDFDDMEILLGLSDSRTGARVAFTLGDLRLAIGVA